MWRVEKYKKKTVHAHSCRQNRRAVIAGMDFYAHFAFDFFSLKPAGFRKTRPRRPVPFRVSNRTAILNDNRFRFVFYACVSSEKKKKHENTLHKSTFFIFFFKVVIIIARLTV